MEQLLSDYLVDCFYKTEHRKDGDTLSPNHDSLTSVRGEMSKTMFLVISFISFVLVLIGWTFISRYHIVSNMFLPSPLQVVKALISWYHTTLLKDATISLYQVSLGFLLSCILAIPMGILSGSMKLFQAATQPLADFGRYLPAAAFIPLVLVWFGIGEMPKIAIIFIGVGYRSFVFTTGGLAAKIGAMALYYPGIFRLE